MSRRSLKSFTVAGLLATGLAVGLSPSVWAEQGGCGQPVSSGPDPVATDCLYLLKTAVGSETCERPCICQPRGVATTAVDALICLQFSVGQPVALDCGCNDTGKPDLESTYTTFDPSVDIVPDMLLTDGHAGEADYAGTNPWGIDDRDIRARYVKTRYIGAFSQDATPEDGDWTAGWTVEVHGNHTIWHPASSGTLNGATPVADGTCPANTTLAGSTTLPGGFSGSMDICQLPGRFAISGGTLTLTNDNIYWTGGLANGGTLIGDGDAPGKTETGLTKAVNSTLEIEPGTLILGGVQEALIITRGSKIYADGTAEDPIVMNSHTWFNNWLTDTDYTGKGVGTGNRREWGGLVLTGFAWANYCPTPGTCDAEVEGLAVPVHYGGTNSAWDAGSVTYVEISNSGYDLGGGNDLNCMTNYTLGYPTIISHIDCNNAGDDSYEFFGGTVVADHLVATYGLDDNLDTDVGFRGGVQFALIRQQTDDGDKCFENDNGPNGDDASAYLQPRSHPHFANVTCLAKHVAAATTGTGMSFRSGTSMSLWNTSIQNAKRAQLRSETADSTIPAGGCQFSGPAGLDAINLDNVWLWEPTPSIKGYFEGINVADTTCVSDLFALNPENSSGVDPQVNLITGYPNQLP